MAGVTLEQYEAAHIQARAAWLWPGDHEIRMMAVEACLMVGIRYLDFLAYLMESTGASADTARRQIAEGLRKAADRIFVTHGYTPAKDAVPDTIPDWMDE